MFELAAACIVVARVPHVASRRRVVVVIFKPREAKPQCSKACVPKCVAVPRVLLFKPRDVKARVCEPESIASGGVNNFTPRIAHPWTQRNDSLHSLSRQNCVECRKTG